jgi:hypothetical protein
MKTSTRRAIRVLLVLALVFLVWFHCLPNGGRPRTVRQAVRRLIEDLPTATLAGVAATPEDELIRYHIGLNMGIRNEYLHPGNLRLTLSAILSSRRIGMIHPDGSSAFITYRLHRELQKRAR